jgi:hypothetical protein
MIVPAFLAFAAAVGLADLAGPGHQWSGLALLTGWFLSARLLPPRAWRWLLTAALALSVVIAAIAIAQIGIQLASNWPPINLQLISNRARGPFASPNFLGAYSVLMLFLAVGRSLYVQTPTSAYRPKVGASVAGCILVPTANLISLALSQSRGALLALGAGLVVMLWLRHRWWALSAAMIATLTAVTIRSGVDEARWEIWRLGWQAAMLRPVTGWGQGGLVIGGLDRFYSIPLEVFIESGILGVAAGAWLLIAVWRVGMRPFLAAWFVQGLFLFSIPATNVLLVTVLAYLASEHRNIADRARGIDDNEPALNGRVRTGGAD